MKWQLQEAKNKLSEVVESARTIGPQVITVRGQTAAIVLSCEEYIRLTGREEPLIEFFHRSPWYNLELELERSSDPGRDITL